MKKSVRMYSWVTLLSSRNQYNIVNELCFSRINILKKIGTQGSRAHSRLLLSACVSHVCLLGNARAQPQNSDPSRSGHFSGQEMVLLSTQRAFAVLSIQCHCCKVEDSCRKKENSNCRARFQLESSVNLWGSKNGSKLLDRVLILALWCLPWKPFRESPRRKLPTQSR